MTRLPSMTAADVIRKLKKCGFIFDRYAKGSHEIWYNADTKRRVTVPQSSGADIPKGTLRAIIKESGYSVEEFVQL